MNCYYPYLNDTNFIMGFYGLFANSNTTYLSFSWNMNFSGPDISNTYLEINKNNFYDTNYSFFQIGFCNGTCPIIQNNSICSLIYVLE